MAIQSHFCMHGVWKSRRLLSNIGNLDNLEYFSSAHDVQMDLSRGKSIFIFMS